ncbi:MAG: hypothetical protein Q8Q52_07220 [Acidimicrobiia bacterium]|nr:hypothetical protein [Acidimicrobiia bacterium]
MVAPGPPPFLERWTTWLNGDLWQDVHGLVQRVTVFYGWDEVVGLAPDTSRAPGDFHNWVNRNYLDALVVSVSRLTDNDHRTASMVRLLTEIADHSSEITRSWFVSRASDFDREAAAARFDRIADANGDRLDPSVPREDCRLLRDSSGTIKSYVDQHIAHLDFNRQVVSLTVGNVHSATSNIYAVFKRWFQVITGNSLVHLTLAPWPHVLTLPWISPESAGAVADSARDRWIQLTDQAARDLDSRP